MFWAGALLVGGTAALFAVIAARADKFSHGFLSLHPLLPFLVIPVGLTAIAWLTRRVFPGSQGSGIPQAIAALNMRGKESLLSLKIAFGKILLTVLGLLCGASIGREGPTVHVGAALMFSLGRIAQFPPHYLERGLILAGGAAGVAAAFNTPLAGVVFVIEEMSRSFEQRTSGIVLTAVIFAGLTAMSILGSYEYFGYSNAAITDLQDWLAIPVCGVIGGLFGGLFSTTLIAASRRIAPIAGRNPLRVAFLCGLALATIGLLSGNLALGTGYEEAKLIVTGAGEHNPAYPILKMLATLASYLSGIPGGIFAPSLATGAGLGDTLGHWLPVAPLEVMILLGMVAYFSGVVQAPMTAFVIVMEMTAQQHMLLALMATALIAHGTSHLVCPRSLYHSLALGFQAPEERPPRAGVR